jgi:peptidoglycan hydrolase-like protein with peptidoglycan-binding domain
MIKNILAVGFGAMLLVAPFVSSASSVSTLTTVVASPIAMPLCPVFTRSLYVGLSGNDVAMLQGYLASQGYFNASATGYFGPITQAAVARWQAQGVVALGGPGSGTFGPLSRAYFSRTCGGSGGTQNTGFSANPQSGSAPLTVQFTSTAPQGGTVGTTVNFGDGTSGTLGVVPVCSSCSLEGVVSHTYTSAGTYNATLTGGNCSCPLNGICNCPNMQILGTATVVVGSGSTPQDIRINAPASVSLSPGGIAEIRNESAYFTLTSETSSSATIQVTPVGCWNAFPSDPTPRIICMIAMIPIPPQTLAVGQTYTSANYSITLNQINNGVATFSVSPR